jgi:uncharacterized membrane protein
MSLPVPSARTAAPWRAWPPALGALTVAWLLVLALAPLAVRAPAGAVRTQAGAVVYAFGRVICHQQAARSFLMAGVQMPVCARCTGLYVGASLGVAMALAAAGRARRLFRFPRRALAIAALPTVLTVVLEVVGRLPDGNLARFAAALPLGAAVAMLLATVGQPD